MARIQVYYKDPKLNARCFIPMQRYEDIWGPETHFLVRKSSTGEFVKSDYEKWKMEEMAMLGLQMTSKDYENRIVADIVDDIIKNVFKKELEQILNCSDSSFNSNFSFSSCSESLNSSISNWSTCSKPSYDLRNLSINANFDTSNLGRTRKTKVRVNYADMDEVPVKKVQAPRKSRKRSVGLQQSVYAHVTASIPENRQNSYEYNPQANYQNEFKPEPIQKAKRKPRQTKPKNVVYNELGYTQTIEAVATRYNELCRETLEDEFEDPQIITPETNSSKEVCQKISEEILEIFPAPSFKSLPSLTDPCEVERFFRDNKTHEIPPIIQIDNPVARFVIESTGSNDYRVNQVNGKLPITIPLQKNHQPIKEDRKNENVAQKRKADDSLKSQEKRRKYISNYTQTDDDRNLTIVNNFNFSTPLSVSDIRLMSDILKPTNINVSTTLQPGPIPKESSVSREKTTKTSTSKITDSSKEKSKVKIVDKEIKKPDRITSVKFDPKKSRSNEKIYVKRFLPFNKQASTSVDTQDNVPVKPMFNLLVKTQTSSSEIKKKFKGMPIQTVTSEKEPLKPLIKAPSLTSLSDLSEGMPIQTVIPDKVPLKPLIIAQSLTSSSNESEVMPIQTVTPEKEPLQPLFKAQSLTSLSYESEGMPLQTVTPEKEPFQPLINAPSNESDPKTIRSNENILDKNSSQFNGEKSSSFDTPEKIMFDSLIKTPTSSSSEIKGNIDGTEIQIDDLEEFNLSLLGPGNEIGLDNSIASIIDELTELTENNDGVQEEIGTNLDILETCSFIDKKKKPLDSLSDLELDYEDEGDIIDLDTDDLLSDTDDIPPPTNNLVTPSKNGNETLTQTTTVKKNDDYVSPDVFANVTPTDIKNIPRIPKKVSLIEITSDLRPVLFSTTTNNSLNSATNSNMNIRKTLFQNKNVNDPRNSGAAVEVPKFNKNISIENSTLSLKNQIIINNVNKAMAQIAQKREEQEAIKLVNSKKVLNPPIISKESLSIPIQPLMSLKVVTNSPVEQRPPLSKINIVFDSICYSYYRGNCTNKKCKFNHHLPTIDRIRDKLKTLNRQEFLETYKVCVSMTILLKQSWIIFVEVATLNKWNQFLNFMIERSDVYALEDINKMWLAVFHAFTKCSMTKQESVSHIIKISGKFRELPQVEVLIDLMVKTNLQFFLKEISYFVKLFKEYQANAFVIEQFYEAVINKPEPDTKFLKLTHDIAFNMNPIEAYKVDQGLIKRFVEIYYSTFPDEAN